ncbi:MAG: hypothetical protein AAF202_11620, partial [Pseudomonadota bacterium]
MQSKNQVSFRLPYWTGLGTWLALMILACAFTIARAADALPKPHTRACGPELLWHLNQPTQLDLSGPFDFSLVPSAWSLRDLRYLDSPTLVTQKSHIYWQSWPKANQRDLKRSTGYTRYDLDRVRHLFLSSEALDTASNLSEAEASEFLLQLEPHLA